VCGIIGYIGPDDALPVLLDGLRRLEYRGYDSAGVAVADQGKVSVIKRPGKIANLAAALEKSRLPGHTGIGHTRWATHGEPNEVNAHPHTSGPITLVHNGIIENYVELKKQLTGHKRQMVSDTDTEVLAHLIAVERESAESLEDAVLKALLQVEGTFGLVVLDEREPNKLVAARRGSPLLLGVTDNAMYLASDATAIIGHTDRVVYLDDDEIAICQAGSYRIIDFEAQAQEHEEHVVELERAAIEKAGYDHFLLKEIMEQPKSIADTLRGRLDFENGTSHLGGLNLPAKDYYRNLNRILTVACGTAGYSGILGKYLIERLTGIPVDVEIASEFRYRDPVTSDNTLGMVITQSGETADTLAGLREMKRRGIHAVGLVNVVGSTIAREADGGVYLHAGPEISVASTKAYTSQVLAQILVGLQIGRSRSLSIREGRTVVRALEELPAQVQTILGQREHIRQIAKQLTRFNNALYVGRDTLYPVALEGSLKLKESAYIHSEAYAAGELKHGAIALVDNDMLVVFLHPQNDLYDKSRSNLEEIKARGGHIVIIGTEGDESLKTYSDHVISIPDSSFWTQPLLANIPLQLLAYYLAVERGTDVDQPRNLAKSVTVE
jgi:glutamine---fructose-6-phosphate transaminase (isomerizing)